MGNSPSSGLDWIPVVSQTKSLVQACQGNMEGARQTQENFSKRCPVVSQSRSAAEALMGDTKAALKTQDEFSRLTPVISQCRSAVEASMGDFKAAEKTQKEFWNEDQGASIGVVLGSIGGALVLPIMGFTSSGVAAGSFAAGIQSSIGNVAAGSAFATAQSLGAAGTGAVVLGTAGGTVGAPIGNAIGSAIGTVEIESDSESDDQNNVTSPKCSIIQTLEKYGLGKYANKLQEQALDDMELWPAVTHETLKEIGMKVGDRLKWDRMVKEILKIFDQHSI